MTVTEWGSDLKPSITVNAKGASVGNRGGKIHFYTRENGTVNPGGRMMIASDGKVGIGTASPTSTLDVNGKVRGTATFTHAGENSSILSTTSSANVFVPNISSVMNLQSGDVVKVDLACNLRNVGGGITYIRVDASSGPGGTWLQTGNWITVDSPTWSGGVSTGLYKATADGNVTFNPVWHTSGGTGSLVYCNMNAFVIGKQ